MLNILRHLIRKILPASTAPAFLDLSNELILQVAGDLGPKDLNSLLQTTSFLGKLLSPALLKRGLSSSIGESTRSLLYWASAHNRRDLVIPLLARTRVDTLDADGTAALHSAVVIGNVVITKLLLENGADVEITNTYGWTPLLCTAISGNYKATKLLLDYGADIELMGSSKFDKRALQYAAGRGHMAIVELLLESGCNGKTTDKFGMNSAQIAAVCGQKGVAKRFLELGFETTTRNSSHVCYVSSLAIIAAESALYMLLRAEYDGCSSCRERRREGGWGATKPAA